MASKIAKKTKKIYIQVEDYKTKISIGQLLQRIAKKEKSICNDIIQVTACVLSDLDIILNMPISEKKLIEIVEYIHKNHIKHFTSFLDLIHTYGIATISFEHELLKKIIKKDPYDCPYCEDSLFLNVQDVYDVDDLTEIVLQCESCDFSIDIEVTEWEVL